jgi:hypothetical protein
MQAGSTNFFKLMATLDEEHINPLRGDAAIAALPAPVKLIQTFNYLKPIIEKLGVDASEFQDFISSGVQELQSAWVKFINSQATIVLTNDLSRLVGITENAFQSESIKTSEVNNIVNFVLTYYSVIHNRSISKKEVIESILLSGIIKKSSFYQKINTADKTNDSFLSWSDESPNKDEIWRHFALQSCRFLKQSVHSLRDVVDEFNDMGVQTRLQELVDRAEYEQFNKLSKKGYSDKIGVFIVFLLGISSMLIMPFFEEDTNNQLNNNSSLVNQHKLHNTVKGSQTVSFSPGTSKPHSFNDLNALTVSTNTNNSSNSFFSPVNKNEWLYYHSEPVIMQK